MTPKELFDSKKVPADNELFATWDYETGKGWIVAWNEDVPAIDEYGNQCESGMRSHFILENISKEKAEQFVADYYWLVDGGNLEPVVAKEMTEAEEKEWRALDDNMDWMNDEQITEASNKIRKKYS